VANLVALLGAQDGSHPVRPDADALADHPRVSIATSGHPEDLVAGALLAFGFKVDPRQVQMFRAD